MRFSKKLLTALLPIAATSALVPVLTSCNKGSAWDFSYGDAINCYKTKPAEGEAAYHSVDEIKNAVKGHTAIESRKTITQAEIDDLNNTWSLEITKQIMYFDLIASNSWINTKSFYLKWDMTTPEISLTYFDKDLEQEVVVQGTKLSYTKGTDDEIDITIMNGATEVGHYKSYNFQNSKIGA